MKNSKRKFNLILYSVVIVVLVCAIIVGGVLFMNGAVAWFAKNKNVSATGMAVNLRDLGIEDTYYIRYDKREDNTFKQVGNSFTFQGLTPGETVTIKAVYKSDREEDRTLKIHFMDMGNGEIPLVKEDADKNKYYYYFGTQLKVTTKALNGGTAEDVNTFLVTPPTYSNDAANPDTPENPQDAGSFIYYTTKLEPASNDLHLADLTVSSTKECTIEFTIEFVNYAKIDQNDYQLFGKGAEQCLRHLVAYVIS